MMIAIKLLGDPQILIQGRTAPAPLPAKAQAALFYLAASGQPATRQRLAGLLWSDQPEEEARRNLRVALNAIQTALPGLLHATRQQLALRQDAYQCDLERFWRGLDSADPAARLQALDLYRGDLLTGFGLRGAALFEEWLAIEREQARQTAAKALKRLAQEALSAGAPQQGLPFAQKWVSLSAWEEDAHLLLMQLYAAAGQRSAALRQFERCRDVLAQELNLEPSPATRQLYERIRQLPAETSAATPPTGAPQNLPAPLTPFIGRRAELEQVEALLRQPGCALVTLTGPGGAGKTRLALAVGQRLAQSADSFPDGVFFVPLAGVETAGGLWSGIAAACGLTLAPRPTEAEQVQRFLRTRRFFLLLDNLEQLESQSGELVTLLAGAPGVKLLVTSRQSLGLYEEWVFEVGGLAQGDRADSDAAQLFYQTARRARLGFDLTAEWPHVQAVCRLVGGLPLGIELAASWARTLAASEIARMIERSQAALDTPLKNLPQRHASLSAVFESSWALLADEEQRALAHLAVFPGEFDLAAAEAVGQVAARSMSRLVSASLAQREASGRYRLHPFIRECALAKLADVAGVFRAHGLYYGEWLAGREAALVRLEAEAMAQAESEMPNLRQMWRWAVETGDAATLARCAAPLAALCDQRGWLREGEELMRIAIDGLPAGSLTGAVARLYAGRLQFRQGRFGEARAALQASLVTIEGQSPPTAPALAAVAQNYLATTLRDLGEIESAQQLFAKSRAAFETLGDAAGLASLAVNEAGLCIRQGRHAQARELSRLALALYRSLNAPGLMVVPLASWGGSSVELGLYDEAQECFAEALEHARQSGNRLMIASLENHLGVLEIHRQNFSAAEAHLRQAQQVAEEIGSLETLARASNDLGALYERQGDLSRALPAFEQALDTNRATQNSFSVVINLNNIGFLLRRLGRVNDAGEYHRQALERARGLEAVSLALDAIIGLGAVLHVRGNPGAARMCFRFVHHHPEADRQTVEELADVLAQIGAELSDDGQPLPGDLAAMAALIRDV